MIVWICRRCQQLYLSATREHGYRCLCGNELTEWPTTLDDPVVLADIIVRRFCAPRD